MSLHILEKGHLVISSEDDAIQCRSFQGQQVAEFRGSLATEVKSLLTGNECPTPILDRLMDSGSEGMRTVVSLIRDERPLTCSRADILRRAGWGQLWVELTAQCNEHCLHCYATSSPQRTEALSREMVESIVDDAANLGFKVLQFTGGDPLLCSFLPDMVERAAGKGIPCIEIFTNGLLLDEALYERLRESGAWFAFSLYGDRALEHDAITRTPGSFERTLTAIRRAVAGNSPVRVALVVMESNAGRVDQTIEMARSLGIPPSSIRINPTTEVGRGQRFRDATFQDDAGHAAGSLAGENSGGDAKVLGKACVGPSGQVYPCIFSRWLELGHIGPGSTLRQILEAESPTHPRPPKPDAWGCLGDRLTCGDCRLTAFLLESELATEDS